jgi:tetratricopeptide (TPR) repeat protein
MSSSIRSRSERWGLAVLLLVVWGLAPRPALGAPLSEQARAEARAKYKAGTEAYEHGDYRKALAAFEDAYQLAPLPGFLFNLAQCHRQLGAYERAATDYRRYLSLSEKEPSNATMVKELIAEMDARAKQEVASRAAREKPVVQVKTVERDRPEALPAKALEPRGEPRRERSGLRDAGRRALDIHKSRSLSERSKPLPAEAMPGMPESEPPKESLSRKWWVWAGAGAAVVLAGGIVYAVASFSSDPRPTTLGTFPAH